MLNFTRPQSIDASFEEAYEYLIRTLEPLSGYPLRLERGPRDGGILRPSRRDDGALQYPLRSAKNRKAYWNLVVPPDGARDRQCTRIVARFMAMCNRMAKEVRQPFDFRDLLIRSGGFLWDDLIVSLIHTSGQKYNALELIAALRDAIGYWRWMGPRERNIAGLRVDLLHWCSISQGNEVAKISVTFIPVNSFN